jgi:uncharacterized protein (DUF2235 family)
MNLDLLRSKHARQDDLARRWICIWLAILLFVGPVSVSKADEHAEGLQSMTQIALVDAKERKSLFVFLDGTQDDAQSGTNVRRLYELISTNHDPQTVSLYIEGVGSDGSQLLGPALGHGMEKRILQGYEFIAQNYNSGDALYIFGFSRGAHEARSLAGLLAYTGVPKLSDRAVGVSSGANTIMELVKKARDREYLEHWVAWTPGQTPPLASTIKDQEMQPIEVEFLGVWDTVPGSSFKKYDMCVEKIGFWKKAFYWLPMISEGERYKSGSYPPIRHIAHAVALDEKRSKFAPLLACSPISSRYTRVDEVWFPGAHADVGGGYEDSNELAGISLNWMIALISETYKFNPGPPRVEENAMGLAHWSIGDPPANLGSVCVDRVPPTDPHLHSSVEARRNAGLVPVKLKEEITHLTYPTKCSDIDTIILERSGEGRCEKRSLLTDVLPDCGLDVPTAHRRRRLFG